MNTHQDKPQNGSAESAANPSARSETGSGADLNQAMLAPGDKAAEPRRSFNVGWNDSPFRPHNFQQRAQLMGKPAVKVLITPRAFQQMLLYVEIANKEVGWLGTVTRLSNDRFLIDETFLLEQEVTAAETELSVEGQNKLTEELLLNGEAGIEQINRLRFWGHSHVRMGTSPSGTDESTMRRFMDEGLEWYVRGIFNKLGRAEFTVYFFDRGYAICDAPWYVVDPTTGENLTPQRTYFGSGPCAQSSYSQPAYRQSGEAQPSEKQAAEAGTTEGSAGTLPGQNDSQPQTLASRLLKRQPDLPPLLVPSAELRQQVEAEFAAKVTERVYHVSLFGGLFGGDAKEPQPTDKAEPKAPGDESPKDPVEEKAQVLPDEGRGTVPMTPSAFPRWQTEKRQSWWSLLLEVLLGSSKK